MEISIAGIEQAVEGLGYRSDKSPKSRLVHTLKKHFLNSDTGESISALDRDELINLMWDLGGNRDAIKSKRKNLSSIKSSVNADLNAAWELGRNPEGINIGPQNTFVMSDAAKDKILNSFSGAMDLDGGNSLDRVTEALKIVSEYLSNLPGGLEEDKLSNLKSLVEGLAGKFKDGGPGEFEITEKRADSTDGEDVDADDASDEQEDVEFVDEDEFPEDTDVGELIGDEAEVEETADEVIEDDLDLLEIDDMEIVEVMDADDAADEQEDLEFVDEDEFPEDADAGELVGDETQGEEIPEENLEDIEDVIEEDGIPGELGADEQDGLELVDEEGILEDDAEIEEIAEGGLDDSEDGIEGEVFDDEMDELEGSLPDDTEIVDVMDEGDLPDEPDEVELDEDVVLEDAGDGEELLDGDMKIEDVDEADLDDIDEVLEEGEADFEEEDVVEMMDEADVSELDEADILEDEDELEEVGEEESEGTSEAEESDDEMQPDDVGLPLDQLSEEALNFEEFEPDEEQKRLLAERFDGYLGAMERYYNQYIIIKKGRYTVGSDISDADVLKERNVNFPDYYVGKYPVTNALFEVFIERTGYKTTAEKLGFGYVYYGRFQKTVDSKTGLLRSVWNPSFTRKKVDGATWYQPTGPGCTLHQKRNHPVVQVSIKDARTFAAWTGKRLPTEIEWEAAARTRSGFNFPWGNDWRDGCCNFENSGIADTCPVDEHPQGMNGAGLADLLGNVLEWTTDECEPKYPLEKPTRFFIAKGGSWVNHEQIHLFERTRFEAEFTANIVGFRCLAD